MRRGAIASALLALAGCGDAPAGPDAAPAGASPAAAAISAAPAAGDAGALAIRQFRLQGHAYAVPAAHIQALRMQPDAFVRIKPPGTLFDLVYDSRSQAAVDRSGAPQVFSVNDGDYPEIDYFAGREGPVVCRRAAAPRGGCGMRIRHGDADWSVLFPRGGLAAAGDIAREAQAALEAYGAGTPPGAPPPP